MYGGIVMLGRLKYIQLSLAFLRLKFLLKSGKVINHQVQVLAELIEAGGDTLCVQWDLRVLMMVSMKMAVFWVLAV
jgi:hypothetical protein